MCFLANKNYSTVRLNLNVNVMQHSRALLLMLTSIS